MRLAVSRLRVALPWLASGSLAVLVTLAVLAPADWVTPWAEQATQGRMRLSEPDGSLWHGSATLALAPTAGDDPAGAVMLPGRLEWRTAFWPLLMGRLRLSLRQSQAMPDPVELDAGWREARLSGGSAQLPASLLVGLGAPFNTLNLQADVRVRWNEWRWFTPGVTSGLPPGVSAGHGGAYGQLDIEARDAVTRVSPVHPLGSYHAVLGAVGTNLTLDLSTLKGPLILSGKGRFGEGGSQFTGHASSAPEAQDSLAGLLNLLGRPTGDGSVLLTFGN